VLDPDPEDADTRAIQALNKRLAGDERVSVCLVPVADGVTLVRRR
jgi:predicted O-methyltransferase YrrM